MPATSYGGRHRNARPAEKEAAGPARRASPQPRRTIFKPKPTNFSHITTRPASEDESDSDGENKEDFVLKESIQVEIEDQLQYKAKLATIPEEPVRHLTFAEATMSTQPRSRSRVGRKVSVNDGSEATLTGPMTLGSFGPFRQTLKKRKKASRLSPIDLPTSKGGSEVGCTSGMDEEKGSTHAVSPNLQTTGFKPFSTPSSRGTIKNFPPFLSFITPDKDKENGGLIGSETEIDVDPTPTQDRFDCTALIHHNFGSTQYLDEEENNCPSSIVADSVSDTQSTKERAEAAMAGIQGAFGSSKGPKPGQEAFDTLEWDPDLLSPSAQDASPEVVAVTPQPVAYTTVGSVINPNNVPQFTAPNRIQREGAGRRPLMPFVQSRPVILHRHQDSYFHGRDPLPPLSMQNSMLYTQQLGHSEASFNQPQQPSSAQSSRSALSTHQLPPLAEQEKLVLKRLHSAGAPQMFSGNIMGSPSTPTPSSKQFINMADCGGMEGVTNHGSLSNVTDPFFSIFLSNNLDTNRPMFAVNESMEEYAQRRGLQSQVQDLQDVPAIQRLSKIGNPVQERSRGQLPEVPVAKFIGKTVANPSGTPISLEDLLRSGPAPTSGELDFSYQFPTPTGPSASMSQPNSLFHVYDASTIQATTSSRALGVPRPLTAGPPGQRHYLGGSSNKASTNRIENFWIKNSEVQGQRQDTNLNQQPYNNAWALDLSLTAPQTSVAKNAQVENDPTKPFDTLPILVASKYFPHGFPSGMTRKFNPLPYETMVKMGQVADATEGEKKERKAKDLNDWFYGGQRRLALSAVDHMDDLARRQLNQATNPGPSSKKSLPPVENNPITIDEMEGMTTAEAAIPAIDALFGTLLAYAERGPESRSRLSRFEKSNDWQIDNSDVGNVSFVSENRESPPERLCIDSRHKSFYHNPSGSPWE